MESLENMVLIMEGQDKVYMDGDVCITCKDGLSLEDEAVAQMYALFGINRAKTFLGTKQIIINKDNKGIRFNFDIHQDLQQYLKDQNEANPLFKHLNLIFNSKSDTYELEAIGDQGVIKQSTDLFFDMVHDEVFNMTGLSVAL